MIKNILRAENLIFFLFSVYFYHFIEGNWVLFFLFFLIPDISMLGYFKNAKVGAFIYNLAHTYIFVAILLISGFAFRNNLLVQLGLIAAAHISIDRFFGYGLKEKTGFKNTHLGKIGK